MKKGDPKRIRLVALGVPEVEWSWCRQPGNQPGPRTLWAPLIVAAGEASTQNSLFLGRGSPAKASKAGVRPGVSDCGGGLDGHAKPVVACLLKPGRKAIRTFSTLTADLRQVLEWLTHEGGTHVASESTGGYWTPVFNLRAGGGEVMLVKARHRKAVPGRQTDVRDCEWLADP